LSGWCLVCWRGHWLKRGVAYISPDLSSTVTTWPSASWRSLSGIPKPGDNRNNRREGGKEGGRGWVAEEGQGWHQDTAMLDPLAAFVHKGVPATSHPLPIPAQSARVCDRCSPAQMVLKSVSVGVVALHVALLVCGRCATERFAKLAAKFSGCWGGRCHHIGWSQVRH